MKKLVLMLLVLCMVTTSLVGCGVKDASDKELKTITIWTNNSHSKPFYLKKTEEFNKTVGKKLGVKVEYIVKENCAQEVELAFASDQAPDLMVGNAQKLAGEGDIIAFDDMKNGKKYVDKYKDYSSSISLFVDGKMYALPKAYSTYGLVYNKDMFKAAGIVDEKGEAKPPRTFDELVEVSKKLTNPSKRQYGIIFQGKIGCAYASLINERAAASGGAVGGFVKKDGKYDFTVQGEIMKTLIKLRDDGSFVPGSNTLTNDAARARFAAGNIGMKFSGSFDYAVFTEQFPIKGFEWGVAPCPVLNADERCYEYALLSGNLLINKKSYEKYGEDIILAVYDYYSSDDFLIEEYKEGYTIPYSYDMIKNVKSDVGEQWDDFAKLLDISATMAKIPGKTQNPVQCDTTGIGPLATTWNSLWAGEIKVSQIDGIVANYNKAMNDGVAKYSQLHPDYVQPVADPTYDTRIKK